MSVTTASDRVRRTVHLWRVLVGARARSQMQYRTSFIIDAFVSFALTAIDFVAILVLFTHLHALGTWTVHDVAFLYGASGIGFALADVFASNLENTSLLVRTGQFDVLLIRPAGSLLQMLTGDISLRSIGRAGQSAVVLAYALLGVSIVWTPMRVLMTLGIVVIGTFIFASIFVIGSCIAFATINGDEAMNAVTFGGSFFAQYPLDIFGPWLRRFLGFIVPTAFIAYFPACYVLDKPIPFGLPSWLSFASPVVAALALAACVLVWRTCVRRYRSTGS
jgi:ABC-2 type transport system permease protein